MASPVDRAGVLARRAAAVWSALAAATGVFWLVVPSAYPFGMADPRAEQSLLSGITSVTGAVALVVLGASGVALAGFLGRTGSASRRIAGGVAMAYAVCFGLLVPDLQLLILFTYLFTAACPLVLVWVLVARARRGVRQAVTVVAVVLVLGLAAWLTGLVTLAVLVDFGHGMATAVATITVRVAYLVFFFLGGVIWAVAAVAGMRVAAGRCGWCGRHGASWTTPAAAARWGKVVTILAAIGPLPYGLFRMTWFGPAESIDAGAAGDLAEQPGLRLWGLMIGVAALIASILTIGLIRRWGEVWPRWVPSLAGRPVPVLLPPIACFVVAAMVTIGGVTLIKQAVTVGESIWEVIALPLPLWGPLLFAAGLAYYYRRRGTCRRCGRGEPPATFVGDVSQESTDRR